MKHTWHYAKKAGWLIAAALLLKLAAAYLELQIPSALADIIYDGVPAAQAAGNLDPILHYGTIMAIFAVAAFLTNLAGNVLSTHASCRITEDMRQDLFRKVSYLSARQVDEVTISSAISRLTSDTYNVNTMFMRCLRMGVRAPILMIGGIIVTLTKDPVLPVALIVMIPLIAFITIKLTRKVIPMFRERQRRLDVMVNAVQAGASGIRVIKALSKTQYEMDHFDKINDDLAEMRYRAGVTNAKIHPITALILNLSLVSVIVLGAVRVTGGQMLPGQIVAFINYFTIILNATMSFSGIFMVLTNGLASAQRIEQVLNMPETMTVEELPPVESEYAVEFRDVCFSYNGVDHNVSHLSFGLKEGETLGIIGATGSGKTTILNLLLRLYDVDEGQILIGGRDVRSIPNDELRAMFGVTFQNDFLFADAIGKNIDFFRDLDPAAVKKAAVLAQAEAFIEDKGGMDATLTIRGNNASGGQRQRLLIARALAGDPKILVLDDASSALDYRTDADLRKALAENYAHTTKFIVAQRVSSIRSADQILVLDGGEVIGHGTHDELMASCEAYREIAHIQMETEEVDDSAS